MTSSNARKKPDASSKRNKHDAKGGSLPKKSASAKKNTSAGKKSGTRAGSSAKSRRSTSKAGGSRSSAPQTDTGIPMGNEIELIVSIGIMLLMLLSNFGKCGKVGVALSSLFFGVFGCVQYVMPVAFCLGVFILIANDYSLLSIKKCTAGFVTLMMISAFAQILYQGGPVKSSELFALAVEDHHAGGIIGGSFGLLLKNGFGTAGALIIVLCCMLLSLIMLTQRSFVGFFQNNVNKGSRFIDKVRENRQLTIEQRRARKALREEEMEDLEDDGEYSQSRVSSVFGRIRRKKGKHDPDSTDRAKLVEEKLLKIQEERSRKEQEKSARIAAERLKQDPQVHRSVPVFTSSEEVKKKDSVQELKPQVYPLSAEDGKPRDFEGELDFSAFSFRTGKSPEEYTRELSRDSREIREFLDSLEEYIPPSRNKAGQADGSAGTGQKKIAAMPGQAGGSAAGKKKPRMTSGQKEITVSGDQITITMDGRRQVPGAASGRPDHAEDPDQGMHAVEPSDERMQAGESYDERERAGELYNQQERAEESYDERERAGELYNQQERAEESCNQREQAGEPSDEQERAEESCNQRGRAGEPSDERERAGELCNQQERAAESYDQRKRAGKSPDQRERLADLPDQPGYAEETTIQPGHTKEVSDQPEYPTASDRKRVVDIDDKQAEDIRINRADAPPKAPARKPAQRDDYVFPPMNLLVTEKQAWSESYDRELKETALKLQTTLESFGVRVTITDISCGPAVTRYEMFPEQGTKVSKIVSLTDDIKLNLAAADVRIEAPIPGKAAIGIEVPNKQTMKVHLRELIDNQVFRNFKSRLAFAVGKDIGGNIVITDLAKMPHLLIAGATGSGKSVCINTLIMSLLYKARPDEVKLIMIDPKMVELSVYNGIPHLLIPVVTDPKKASGALNWAVAEMTDRYKKFAESNVRNLEGYNKRVEELIASGEVDEEKLAKMPQIVIIIDELADLMMVAPGEVEDAIVRLSQLARAAGIHLVIATQRPSVNVITGLIKANVPSRIAFSVSSGVDSRTIIDMNGAEKLLGKGDMLFFPAGYQKPVRVQGALVDDSEVAKVVEFIKMNEDIAVYDDGVSNQIEKKIEHSGGSAERDEYFEAAARFIMEKDKATIGMLQRMFKIGFNRAARIMDQLADAGIVGPEEGTKPRQILMSPEQLDEYFEEYI